MNKFSTIIKSIAPRKYLYTFSQQQSLYVDSRFKMQLASRILSDIEIEQIKQTIDSTLTLINAQKLTNKNNQFISSQLLKSVLEFKSILKQNDIKLKMQRIDQKQMITKGNYQVKGLKYPVDGLFIHQLKMERIGQILFCRLRDQVQTSEKDNLEAATEQFAKKFKTNEMRGHVLQNKMKQKVQQFIKLKQQIAANTFYNKFKSNLSNYSIVVDEIPISVKCLMTKNNKIQEQSILSLRTKWLHEVQEKTTQSVKKYLKRTLFDIQNWHRGFFVPIYPFDLQ